MTINERIVGNKHLNINEDFIPTFFLIRYILIPSIMMTLHNSAKATMIKLYRTPTKTKLVNKRNEAMLSFISRIRSTYSPQNRVSNDTY